MPRLTDDQVRRICAVVTDNPGHPGIGTAAQLIRATEDVVLRGSLPPQRTYDRDGEFNVIYDYADRDRDRVVVRTGVGPDVDLLAIVYKSPGALPGQAAGAVELTREDARVLRDQLSHWLIEREAAGA